MKHDGEEKAILGDGFQNNGIDQVQLFLFLFRGTRQDGIHLDPESKKHQRGRQSDPAKVEDTLVKDVRVFTTPTGHQDIAQSD